MLKKLLLVLPILFFVFINIAYCTNLQEDNIDIILNNLKKQNLSIKDFQANYTQTISYFSTDEVLESNGFLKYKKQNFIYLQQIEPKKQETYIDGKYITIYVPNNKQAIVEKWKDMLSSDMLLTSVFKFVNNFDTLKKEYLLELKNQTNVYWSFLIKPKKQNEKFEMIVNISKNSYLIMSVYFNNDNFSISINLTDYQLNNNFTNNLFKFVAPKNVDIIQL